MYDINSLKLGIEACKKNIVTFEEAIKKEQQTIADYKIMMNEIQKKEDAKAIEG